MFKSLIAQIALLSCIGFITGCGPDEKDNTPNYEEGKTLARQAALMMESRYGSVPEGLDVFTHVFSGETAQKTQSFAQEIERFANDQALQNLMLATFISSHPVYTYNHVLLREFWNDGHRQELEGTYPIGESVDPATGLTLNFSKSGSDGNFQFVFNLTGTLDICSILGVTVSDCLSHIDVTYNMTTSGYGVGNVIGEIESFDFRMEKLELQFSGTVTNSSYQLNIQNGNFSSPGEDIQELQWYFFPADIDTFIIQAPITSLGFDATITPIGESSSLEVTFPIAVTIDGGGIQAQGALIEDNQAAPDLPLDIIAVIQNANLNLGPFVFSKQNGNQAWVDLSFKTNIEYVKLQMSNLGPCSHYPNCFAMFIATAVEYFQNGDEQGTHPGFTFNGDYGFSIDGEISEGSNHFEQTENLQHRWTLTSNYQNQLYTGEIEASEWFIKNALRFTNKNGAEIFATFNEDGSLATASITDSQGNNLGDLIELNGELIAQFDDGDNITLEQ